MRLRALTSLTLLLAASEARAGDFELMLGGFEITSTTSKSSGKVANFGAYRIGYSEPFLDHFSLGIAYNVVMSSAIGGDLGYGLDVGLNWFPVSRSGKVEVKGPEAAFVFMDTWRPYVGVTFNQRQFQSIQAGYAGGGAHVGCERTLTHVLSGKAEVQYLLLSGPLQGSVTEVDGYAGVSFSF